MLKKITDKIVFADWVTYDPRYRRLDIYDRLLDGTFYEHLPYAFYDETDQIGRYVPLSERRPSVQYGLPQLIAKTVARKLFAGRHRPIFINVSDETASVVNMFLTGANVYEKMLQAVFWGSVGSVAVTFSFIQGKLRLDVWRAKWCHPTFDECHCLEKLRVCYPVLGLTLKKNGQLVDEDGQPIELKEKYWWVRDFSTSQELTYRPILESKWNPVTGEDKFLQLPEDGLITHDLGFVPGEWLVNLSGGLFPDGSCTWDAAIPSAVEIDYTLSQLGRGVRYNASPELVVKGELENYEDGESSVIIRGPVNMLKFKSGMRDSEGVTAEGGDAKLLEMTGQGIIAGLSYVDKVRKYALETLTAIRKDPEQMKGPLSGRAMELVDEEFLDMVFELQTAYGNNGLLVLMKKIVQVAEKLGLVTGLTADCETMTLHWPRAYTPVPSEMVQIVQAFSQATNPENPLFTEKKELQDHLRAQLDMPLKPATEQQVKLKTPGTPAEEAAERAGQPASGRPLPPSQVSITDQSGTGEGSQEVRIDA